MTLVRVIFAANWTIANGTTDSYDGSQSVTQPTILWALLALVLNAMSQPSTTSTTLFKTGPYHEGSLVALSSSPLICLLDAILEVAILIGAAWYGLQRQPASNDEESSNEHEAGGTSTAAEPDSDDETLFERPSWAIVMFRVTLLLFGVLPPAIKLFAMRGVVGSQIMAAFMLPLSILRLLPVSSSKAYRKAHRGVTSWLEEGQASILCALFYIHAAVYQTLWHRISGRIWRWMVLKSINFAELGRHIDTVSDILVALIQLFAIISWVIVACGWRKTFFIYTRRKPLPSQPVLVVLAVAGYVKFLGKYISANAEARQDSIDICILGTPENFWANTFPLVFLAGGLSLLIAWVLSLTFEAIFRAAASETTEDREKDHVELQSPGQSSNPQVTSPANEDFGSQITQERSVGKSISRIDAFAMQFVLFGLTMYCGKKIWWAYIIYFVLVPENLRRYIWHSLIEKSILLTAFAIFNLLTATLHYALVFDSAGTLNPGWTGIFGR